MKKYLVIGNPINHSLSPQLHNHWLKQNKINAIYEKEKIDLNDLKNLVLRVKKSEIYGLNITVPFKNDIISFLDKLSLEAESTQSVNTIHLKNNELVGYNTDVDGFELAIKASKYDVSGKKVFILGAGGVVPSIIFTLKKMGASEIIVSNRTKNKADKLKKLFDNLTIVDWGEVPYFDMIINATSLGLNDKDEINLNFSKVEKGKFFYDVIYNPSETNFLKKAKLMGHKIENGKKMFMYQGASAFNIWHGVYPKIDEKIEKILTL